MISPLSDKSVQLVKCKTALSKSGLGDVDYALNPYRGCSHGCLYCYAPDVTRCEKGEEWGSWVEAKTNISRMLKKEIDSVGEEVIGLATVTDPYLRAEERLGLTRACLEVIAGSKASLMLMTKSPLILRDIDLIRRMKKVEVCVTITTLDVKAASFFEPNVVEPIKRVELLHAINDAGIATDVMISPFLSTTDEPIKELKELIRRISIIGCKSFTIDRLKLRPIGIKRIDSLLKNNPLHAASIKEIAFRSENMNLAKVIESLRQDEEFHGLKITAPRIDSSLF